MKQVFFLMIATFIFASCNTGKSSEKFIPKSDTTKIQAVYIDFSDSLKIKNGIVFEIVRDVIDVDSTLKVSKIKDSLFYYRPEKDTTLSWKLILRPAISTERNLDIAIKDLSNFVEKIRKQDSLTNKKK